MTKHSLIYYRNGTVQLQIQLMEQLQKPIAKDSITINIGGALCSMPQSLADAHY